MKEEFDRRASGLPNAPKAPHETRYLSTPAPAPTPAGVPPAPMKKAHEVPAKDWTAGKGQTSKAVVPAKDWGRASEPADRPAAPVSAKDWNAKPQAPRETKPLLPRDPDRDRDR